MNKSISGWKRILYHRTERIRCTILSVCVSHSHTDIQSAYSASSVSPTVPYAYQPWETYSNTTVQLTQRQGNPAPLETLSFTLLFSVWREKGWCKTYLQIMIRTEIWGLNIKHIVLCCFQLRIRISKMISKLWQSVLFVLHSAPSGGVVAATLDFIATAVKAVKSFFSVFVPTRLLMSHCVCCSV